MNIYIYILLCACVRIHYIHLNIYICIYTHTRAYSLSLSLLYWFWLTGFDIVRVYWYALLGKSWAQHLPSACEILCQPVVIGKNNKEMWNKNSFQFSMDWFKGTSTGKQWKAWYLPGIDGFPPDFTFSLEEMLWHFGWASTWGVDQRHSEPYGGHLQLNHQFLWNLITLGSLAAKISQQTRIKPSKRAI